MSHLPGEMTKQSLSAPPANIRSTRYSLTARGRSVPSSRRLPTGSSSFEKASGWMRVPLPAAGMMPSMSGPPCAGGGRHRRIEQRFELLGATRCGVLGKRALARRGGEGGKNVVAEIDRVEGRLA